ncbi:MULTISPECIES: DNA polymerase IV [unclassified Paenibacillus]|uniref:DNA polymerase IV n=1 Tax=unclassified Paenibacillus TaxID=185978 RepID=UPI001AEA41E0|nr:MULTISPECIES: DNA polymerase IV [unclassified Paenibacillus]MBP1154782.1 DNA polymerase-4 [Paenibacillus sp. PvP091]MBP1169834.1 DNA polymerase-4 [Paenibacillus sp. PvR098]MBP2440862.1 DNA polymerase-4 [Paenibacillus sp. PvP052]
MPDKKPGSGDSYPVNGRVILHIDMNAFYCSVHEAVEPDKYKNKPLAVAGSVELRKGIIVTCSYQARSKGVKTGMLVGQALKLCPELVLIRPDFDLYRSFSRRFMKIAYEYSPLVEGMSIDECYVDITGSKALGTPLEIASAIQERILLELHLPCSVGVAPNRLLAKMASDMKKPNGISVLRKRDVPAMLWPHPCSYLYGIGKKTADKLKRLQIHTLGQLAHADAELLTKHFGVLGVVLKRGANGEDDSTVNPEREQSKSIGHTTTLPVNYTDRTDIQRVFLNLADQVGRRLRKQGLLAETVQITIRDPDMKTITRAAKLDGPTENASDFYRHACRLFDVHWKAGEPVRLLGITLQSLTSKQEASVQLDLFSYQKQPAKEKLNQTLDALRDKFGEGAVLTAGMLGDDPSTLIRNGKIRGTSLQMDHLRLKGLEEEE